MDKSFNIALMISMLFHMAMFLPLPHFNNPSAERTFSTVKITYLMPEQDYPAKVNAKRERTTAVTVPKKDIKKIMSEFRSKVKSVESPQKKPVQTPTSKKQNLDIEIPPELPKDKEALYIDYYQSVREKIRRYVELNYPHFIACGEVCLYFILSSDGKLKEISIAEESTIQNYLLKRIAKKSILQASPFSTFPEGLQQPQLSFKVLISFEVE